MNYYLRFGKTFFLTLYMLAIPFLYMLEFYSFQHTFYLSDYVLMVLWGLLLITKILPRLLKFLYFIILKKPVLTVTGSFLFDHYRNIKYYWDDIDQIIASDNYLKIALIEPEKYLKKVPNPLFRFRIQTLSYFLKKRSFFKIEIDILDIKKGEDKKFLDTINRFSVIPKVSCPIPNSNSWLYSTR